MNMDENKIDKEIESIINGIKHDITDIKELDIRENCLFCNSQDISDNICNDCGNYNQ